ncbi:hypothetical protein L208DRAFT_497662 [Tricholoma matsutake]|nr:hypothetical protein L208DRAFT_497662 [Tricholoma matsutake 945]
MCTQSIITSPLPTVDNPHTPDTASPPSSSSQCTLSPPACNLPSRNMQALLLGYRENGIGAMAQAWTYVDMAILIAQDLGMHRSADGGIGKRLVGCCLACGSWKRGKGLCYYE